MQRFRKGRTKLLIATDVAARGLDLPGLPLVIQLEPALDADHYVHRSGRTARMGREGTSVTLIAPEERFIVDKLEKQLDISIEPMMLYEGRVVSYEEGLSRKEAGGRSRRAPAGDGAAAKDGSSAWKSKGEYLASLETRKQADSKGAPDGDARRDRAQPARKAAKEVPASPAAPAAAKPKPKPGKTKSERARDQKNKGAPKWLKAKREAASAPKQD